MIFGLGVKGVSAMAGALLMTGVIIGSAVVLADDGGFGVVEAPAWESGYAWAYDLVADFGYDIHVPGQIDDAASAAFGPYALEQEVLSTVFDHEGQPLYISAANFPLVTALDDALLTSFEGAICAERWPAVQRQSDLAAVPTKIIWSDEDPCMVSGLQFGRDPMISYIDFPIEKGKTWGDTIPIDEVYTEGIPYFEQFPGIAMKAEVGSMQTLDLPVGKTKAVRIDFAYRPIGLDAILEEIKEDAEAFGAQVDRLDVRVALHNIVHYSPTYQNIVRDEWLATASVDIAATIDGYDLEVDLESYGRIVGELTGAQLVGKAEKTLPEVYDVLSGKQPIAQVVGQTIEEEMEAYDISIKGSTLEVNAAESPVVSFVTSVFREGGLPEEHALINSIYDAGGSRVFSSLGPSFDYAFKEPGVFTVTSEARDGDGDLWAHDAATVVADYNTTVSASCGIFYVQAEPLTRCGSALVPVNPGIKSLFVTADGYSLTPEILSNRLEIISPDGAIFSDPNAVFLKGEALEDTGRWTASWREPVGLLSGVDYHIMLDYDAANALPSPVRGDGAGAVHGDSGALFSIMLEPLGAALQGAFSDDEMVLPSMADLLV